MGLCSSEKLNNVYLKAISVGTIILTIKSYSRLSSRLRIYNTLVFKIKFQNNYNSKINKILRREECTLRSYIM